MSCTTEIQTLKDTAIRLNYIHGTQLVQLESNLEFYKEEFKKADNAHGIVDLSKDFYAKAIDLILKSSVGELEKVINSALAHVFFDKDYKIIIELEDKRNNKEISFILKDCGFADPVEADIRNSVGMGVRTVISFVLHAFNVYSTGSYPVLFLDESVAKVSSAYIDRLMEYISLFCKEKNLHVVLINHDERFMDFADIRYSCSDGVFTQVK